MASEWTLSAGVGASLGGDLRLGDERFGLGPGPVGSVAAAYRVLDGSDRYLPFVLVGFAVSASTVTTESDWTKLRARMTSVDLRAAVTAGKVFLDALAPYAVVRGFGGPIFWEIQGVDATGSDRYHFQLGAGALVLTGVVDAFFEIIPLGERAVTVGAGVSF